MRTLQALGLCLTYPEAVWVDALEELRLVFVEERLLSAATLRAVTAFLDGFAGRPLLELQEEYCALFDGHRALSLHLFEHVHGDSRERGAALSALSKLYASRGLELAVLELPDHLPVVCEFMSRTDRGAALALLRDTQGVLTTLHTALSERGSRYTAPFTALLELGASGLERVPSSDPARAETHALALGDTATPGDTVTSRSAAGSQAAATNRDAAAEGLSEVAPDFERIDHEWEEAPVEFGLGAGHDSCAPERPPIQLRRGSSAPKAESTNLDAPGGAQRHGT